MTVRYTPMTCRYCGTVIAPTVAEVREPKTVNKYDDCNYRCPNPACCIGYSNATKEAARRAIHPDFLLNVPAHPDALRTELPAVLDRAINRRNQRNKKFKFAFVTSEDALTWVTFWYLNQRNEVGVALGAGPTRPEHLLLWGSELPGGDVLLRERLLSLLKNELAENPGSLSEPDVIVVVKKRLYFIEVKYTSPNDDPKGRPNYHWDKYLARRDSLFSVNSEEVTQSRLYELTRNWVIGKLLAADLGISFTLINLGPKTCRASSDRFREIIAAEPDEYRFVTWREFVGGFNQPLEAWFADYIAEKFRLGGIEGTLNG